MKPTGFSLVEVLVATTITIVAVVSLAPLVAVSITANRSARATTTAVLLAEAQLERLRSLDWEDVALSPSPPGALSANTPGFVDYLDLHGVELSGSASASAPAVPPAHTVYVRRWSVEPLPGINAIVLQVQVIGWPARAGDAVRTTSVRTRKGR